MEEESNSCWTITLRPGEAIDYPEALKELDSHNEIYILPPLKKFLDYVFLFPSCSIKAYSRTERKEYAHENFIYYKSAWYKPKDIDKNIRSVGLATSNVFAVIEYYVESLGGKNYYKFPYPYFDFTTAQQNEFKQKAIQPVRDLLSKYKLLTPDNRGKGTSKDREMRSLVREIVVQAYNKFSRKKPLPIKAIKNQLSQVISSKFPDNLTIYEKYALPSDDSIRRILKEADLA